jgi:hypothetical protein
MRINKSKGEIEKFSSTSILSEESKSGKYHSIQIVEIRSEDNAWNSKVNLFFFYLIF